MMKVTALIMAGGRGERFWPRSRRNFPKQFLSLTGDGRTMLQLTVGRILPLVAIEDVFVVTNKDYKALVKEQLPDLPQENILCEPIGRNTAPCIGLGATYIAHKYGDALMVVLPSDHLVKCNDIFLEILQEACRVAEEGMNLVTIGVTPDYPETGYGYIKYNPERKKGKAYLAERFVEKPSLAAAKEYVEKGGYLWNSGMFVWKVSSIQGKMEQLMGDTWQGLLKIKDSIGTEKERQVLEEVFKGFPSVSIDYGIMEKTEDIYTIPGKFGWDDVGSWLAIGRIRDVDKFGNAVSGNVITVDSRNCIIEGAGKLTVAVGVEDMVIVDSEDAILICKRNATGKIRNVLEALKRGNKEEYV